MTEATLSPAKSAPPARERSSESAPQRMRIRRAAVLGAGVMGAQIAAHLANANVKPYLFELAAEGKDKSANVSHLNAFYMGCGLMLLLFANRIMQGGIG